MTGLTGKCLKEDGKKSMQFFFMDDTEIVFDSRKMSTGDLYLAINGQTDLDLLLEIDEVISGMEIGYNYGKAIENDDKTMDLLIIDSNDRFASIAGCSNKDIIGKTYTGIFGRNGYTESVIKKVSDAAIFSSNTRYIQFARTGDESFEADVRGRGNGSFVSIFKEIPGNGEMMSHKYGKYCSSINTILKSISSSEAMIFFIDIPYKIKNDISVLSSVKTACELGLLDKNKFRPDDLVINRLHPESCIACSSPVIHRELEIYYFFHF